MNPKTVQEVVIKFKTVNNAAWQSVRLEPWQYYESDNSEIDADAVPLHDHARDYLDLDHSSLQVTRLEIRADGELSTTTETFWSCGDSRVIERIDSGAYPYWELIVDVQSDASLPSSTLVRLIREDDAFRVVYHGTIHDNQDGSQSEVVYVPEPNMKQTT